MDSRTSSRPMRVASTMSENDRFLKSNAAPRSGMMMTKSLAPTVPARTKAGISAAKEGFCKTVRVAPGLNKSSAVSDNSMFGASGMSAPTPGSTRRPRSLAWAVPCKLKWMFDVLISLKAKRLSSALPLPGFLSSDTPAVADSCRPEPEPWPPAVALRKPSCRPTSRSEILA